MKGFRFGSVQGSFYILPCPAATAGKPPSATRRWAPKHAADQLARGAYCDNLVELDTATLEVPEQLADWEIVHV